MPDFDLFISYRRRDAERVQPLVDALGDRGVSVWLDQHAIGEFAPITTEIRQGLAHSKALLAWYSTAYPQSRPCQMELAAAFLAAQREGDPRRRVLVINPELSAVHIEPIELRDAQYAAAPVAAADYEALADRLAAHVAPLPGFLGGILPMGPPMQYGQRLTGASRFVGRLPDLWRIHSALHAGESAIISGTHAPGMAIVSGFGGIGKSLLAEEYALRFGAAFPGGIFWLRSLGNHPTGGSNAATLDGVRLEQFAVMANAFNIDTKGLEPGQIEAQLGATLSSRRQPFLWIVDDLASGLETDTVRTWLAPSPLGKTLVTTRSGAYTEIGSQATHIPLGMLPRDEALSLLCSRRAPVGALEEGAARGIVDDLGAHALAVAIAGASLAAHDGVTSFEEYRAKLSNPRQDALELAAKLAPELPSGHDKSVAATILGSVRSLPEEGRDFLRLAAMLAAAPIPPSLVVQTFLVVDSLAESDAEVRAINGLSQAERSSLADQEHEAGRQVHALVSRTVRFHDEKPGRSEGLRSAVIATLTTVLARKLTPNREALALHSQHARTLLGTQERWNFQIAKLAAQVARSDYQRGLYRGARSLQEHLLNAYRQVSGEDHPDTLTAMHDLALTLFRLGSLARARGFQERLFEARRRVSGEDHSDTLGSMGNLALTLFAQGDFVGARALQEQVLEAHRRMMGEDHPDTLMSMNNLAKTLSRQGEWADARALGERVLRARREVLGEDHPDTVASMNNLAATLAAVGDLASARALQEQVLEADRRVLGEDHPETLMGMNNFAMMLLDQGDLVGARALQEQVLEAMRQMLGEDHANTLSCMNNLALMLSKEEDLAGARALHERVLNAQRRVLGEDHPDTFRSMSNLAMMLLDQGDLVGGRALQEEALQAQRRVLGENHPDTLTNLNNLALTLADQGDLAGARTLMEQALDARRRVLGEAHPDTLTSMKILAAMLADQGEPAGGRGVRKRASTGRVVVCIFIAMGVIAFLIWWSRSA